MGVMPIPCPHFKITIVKRSQGQSAVAGAAYQSGERLFSEYDQRTKFYNKKKELVHAEIMLPSYAPPGYADRATLWNAVEAVENQWNSQLARRIVLAFPVEVPKEQYLSMIKEFCQEQFVSKGMIADFAIHDKGDGNPHAHILLTLRAIDEHGKWLPKARKVYDLDENGERIRLASGNWKCHKENTVDWNDQKYAEVWRHGWETITNRYLEAAGRPERVDLRSFERQGIQQIPTVHLGPAAHQMEKRGVETFLGNLNRDIRAANSLMQSIRSAIRGLQRWIADLNEKKQILLDALEQAKEPMLSDLLVDYFNLRNEQRSDWSGKAKLKCTVRDFEEVKRAVDYLKAHSLNTIEDLDTAISNLNQTAAPLRRQLKQNENRMRAIAQIKDAAAAHAKLKPIHDTFIKKNFKLTKDAYAFIVATHTDREHIHNHIIYNSTALDSIRKFRDFLLSGLAVQRLSDLICLEHQLSVIEIKPYRERQKRTLYPPKESNRDRLCGVIDTVLAEKPKDYEDFLQGLEQQGYEVKRGKYTSVKGARQKRFIRFRTLGAGYSEEELKAVISGEAEHHPRQKQKRIVPEQKFQMLVDIQAKLAEGKSMGYARWAKRYNLKEMSKTLIFLQEHKIGSIKEMQERVDAATARYHELGDSIKAAEARMTEIAVLRTHIVNYARTRPVYDAYRKAGYSKRFLEAHREEITLHKAAKAAFDEAGLKKLPKTKDLSIEYAELLKKKKEAYPDYRKAQDEMQELMKAQKNVEMFFAEEKDTAEKEPTR